MKTLSHLCCGAQLSAKAYQTVLSLLPCCRRSDLNCLLRHGSQTANQMTKWLPKGNLDTGGIRAWLRELLADGLVVVDAIVADPASGIKVRPYRALLPGEAAPQELPVKPTLASSKHENAALLRKLDHSSQMFAAYDQRLQRLLDEVREALWLWTHI